MSKKTVYIPLDAFELKSYIILKKERKKYYSKVEVLKKLQAYCAYQDRCHKEVRSKILEYQIYGDDLEEIIISLIQDRFLNEERFARSFARGKFNIKKWGRNKIQQELKKRDISNYCMKKAMEEIDEDDYIHTLYIIVEKKYQTLKTKDSFVARKKLYEYAYRKGYESHLIQQAIGDITS